MKNVDVVVIGGSAAGIPAAVTARSHYPEKKIMVVRKEKQVLIPCGIPYIFGTVGSTENNLIPDAVYEKNNIELMVDDVTEIDAEKKTLAFSSGDSVAYDKLVLATGSSPLIPPITGIEKENIFSVCKAVDYLNRFKALLESGVTDLVLVGGGYIGVEFADECAKTDGLNVTVIEMLPRCLQLAYDDEICEQVEAKLSERGISIRTSEKVIEFTGNGKVEAVKLDGGEEIKADAVLLGIGAKANTSLAENAGLEIGPRGGIQVDLNMRTSNEHIFACGDCAEKRSFFTGQPTQLKLASIATAEARIAGANLFGNQRKNTGTLGVFSTAFDGLTFCRAGMTEREAQQYNFNYVVGTAEAPNRHPGKMPGMSKIWVKLIFERATQHIIGGQIMGGESAGEMINTVSACIQKHMSINDIATFQTGTHPALTASPIAYQMVNAAESAKKMLNA